MCFIIVLKLMFCQRRVVDAEIEYLRLLRRCGRGRFDDLRLLMGRNITGRSRTLQIFSRAIMASNCALYFACSA